MEKCRKVGIIGAGAGWDKAPYDDPEWEFWSLNNLYRKLDTTKFSRWFELHDFECDKDGDYKRRKVYSYSNMSINDYMKAIADLNIPVYMQQKWGIIPKSRKFPFKAIMKRYGKYFGCSFAWMIGFILHENEKAAEKKVDTIGFWGVDLIGHEYLYQRPTTEYMIGLAKGRGIKIIIGKDSELLRMPFIYALDEDSDLIHLLYTNDMINQMVLWYQGFMVRAWNNDIGG
uniref:Uncharacterized protein n=1 Tax=viral metagenome TaxID=1070528 RepID=A0A6M3JWJ9_9ZZZZ